MNVIVTGGAGFLGSHLTEALLKEGNEVFVIDNLMTGKQKTLNPLKATYGKKLQVLTDDIVEMESNWWWKDRKYDMIFNFACPASPPAYQIDPIHTMMTCVVGTRNMLEVAKRDGAILIQASTSEIYGDPEVHPQVESYKGCVNTLGPRACYDEGKRAAETLCMDYNRQYGVDARLVRVFNTYGPHMDPNDGRVVSNMICQVLRNEKLTIYGHGNQTRSFCYVDDLIRGFMAIAMLKKNPQTPINIGNPNEFTINELAQRIIYQVKAFGEGNPSQINLTHWVEYRDIPKDDPKQRRPDITLAKTLLGWEPQIQLHEGLEKTIKYFQSVI